MTNSINKIISKNDFINHKIEEFKQHPHRLDLITYFVDFFGPFKKDEKVDLKARVEEYDKNKVNFNELQLGLTLCQNAKLGDCPKLEELDKKFSKLFPHDYEHELYYKLKEVYRENYDPDNLPSALKYPKTKYTVTIGSIIYLFYGLDYDDRCNDYYTTTYTHIPIKCKVVGTDIYGSLQVKFYNMIEGMNELCEIEVEENYDAENHFQYYFQLNYSPKDIE
jgi:hypothetical protein